MLNFILKALMLVKSTTELADGAGGSNPTLDPIYNMLSILGPAAMGICLAVGAIYGIVLGVQYSKASGADEREKIKKRIVSFFIGLLAILILIAVLYVLRDPLSNFLSNNT